MADVLRLLRSVLVSLRLTVVLLAMSIVLVFWATLDQVHLGVWGVQQKFFHAFLVFIHLGGLVVPVYPGGYVLGLLLLANLIAAHLFRLRLTWRKLGIWLAHGGLILLLVGELVSGLVQRDYMMRLDEGETKSYAESNRDYELAVVDATDPNFDDVVAIPTALLARDAAIQNPKLPFKVVPKGYFPNSDVQMRASVPNAPASPATAGMGPMLAITPLALDYSEDAHNSPAAYVELVGPAGSLGTFALVDSTRLPNPQSFSFAGRTFKLFLRPARRYQPFSLTLEKFSHDVYAGTDIPKNFSSKVRLNPPDAPSREFLIFMNNPLRFGGLTFYQASYVPGDTTADEHTTILQVVRNPSWLVPYIACAAITLGLVIQFLLHLAGFAKRRAA